MPWNGQWFEENDPEGVAFEYDVITTRYRRIATKHHGPNARLQYR